jgi:hypothetical protein
LKRGRERSGTGDVRGSKTHRRSASHSTAPTVPSTEDDEVEVDPPDGSSPQGSSRSTGGFSRGRAMGNNFNWGDVNYVWILQIGMPQLMARSCYLLIGNRLCSIYEFHYKGYF